MEELQEVEVLIVQTVEEVDHLRLDLEEVLLVHEHQEEVTLGERDPVEVLMVHALHLDQGLEELARDDLEEEAEVVFVVLQEKDLVEVKESTVIDL